MITASEYRARVSGRGDTARLEKRIDEAITDHIEGGWGFADAMPIKIGIKGYTADAIERVLSQYRAAGWQIRFESDWRDGDYLELRAP